MIAALNRFAMARGLPFPRMKDESSVDGALAALRARSGELVALAKTWVEINSYTANIVGVNEVGARLREAFALPGLAGTTISGGPSHGDHLIWRTAAAGA